ncbi:MAG: nuclear transport factor 2 family protein [Pseudomonadota bacterium]
MPNKFVCARTILIGLSVGLVACSSGSTQSAAEMQKLVELQAHLAKVERAVDVAKAASDIRRLQRTYGYYLDKGLADDLADLFSKDATAQYSKGGVHIGRDNIRRAMHYLGPNNNLIEGRMNTHTQLQGVVHVAPDSKTAKARWRILAMTANYGERASWGEGPYEVEYANEDGVWKIKKLVWYGVVSGALYEGGWTKKRPPVVRKPGSTPQGNAPTTIPDLKFYPDVYLPPYHYKNPVTGK